MVNSQLLPTVKPQVRAHLPTTANKPQPCGTDSGPTPLRRPLAPSGTGHPPRRPNHPAATHRTRAPAPRPGQDAGPTAAGLNRRTASGNPHQPRTFGPRLPGAPSGKPTRRHHALSISRRGSTRPARADSCRPEERRARSIAVRVSDAPHGWRLVLSMAGVVLVRPVYSARACWRRPGSSTWFCLEEGGGELAHCQDAVECRLARVELRVVLRDLAYVSLSANARLVGEVGLQVQKRCAHGRG